MRAILNEIFLIAIICNGFDIATWPKMILGKYGDWLKRNENHWWTKPIGGCVYCTPGLFGVVIHSLLVSLGFSQGWLTLLLILPGAIYASALLNSIFEKLLK